MATRNTIAERAASAAAYLPLLGRIILLFLPTRRSPGVRFHVFQATLFGLVSSVLLGGLFCYRHVHCIGCLLNAVAVADLTLLITLALMAFLARPIVLPVLGSVARRLAAVGNIRQALVFVNSSQTAERNAKSVAATTSWWQLALLITGTHFSVSSGVGFLALFGVSVQTGVFRWSTFNQRRARGHSIEEAAVEGAVLRLRPILMTMLVATLGLLPAALSRGIGSDSQRPFAIVIVGGLTAALLLSIFLLSTLYVWISREADALPEPDKEHFEAL